MINQMPFAKDCEEEALRLALTNRQAQRDLAKNLSIGLSTLTRWIGRRRDRDIDLPDKLRSGGRMGEFQTATRRKRHHPI